MLALPGGTTLSKMLICFSRWRTLGVEDVLYLLFQVYRKVHSTAVEKIAVVFHRPLRVAGLCSQRRGLMSKSNVFLSIAASLLGVVATGSAARAAFIVNIQQVGPDVVATGSGSIDTDSLTPPANPGSGYHSFVYSYFAEVLLGGGTTDSVYSGITSGPQNFSSTFAGSTRATTSSGDDVGVEGSVNQEAIVLPVGYVSEAPLLDTSTWSNNTLAGLNLVPGVYVESFGSGPTADTFTVSVGQSVPEPASLAAIGIPSAFALLRRRRTAI
jgi:hypothetical protein